MDIVEYVEQVCEFPLLDSQKEFVRVAYESIKNNTRIMYVPARGQHRFYFELLYAIVTIVVGQEKGLMKGDVTNDN